MEFQCSCCRRMVPRLAHVPKQSFCSRLRCQRERRRRWQRNKLAADADYRLNQQAACQAWRSAHPEYWPTYRAQHPDAVARNRAAQRARNATNRSPPPAPPVLEDASPIANMDAFSAPISPVVPGRYRLIPDNTRGAGAIANMDAYFLVELAVISSGYSPSTPRVQPPFQ